MPSSGNSSSDDSDDESCASKGSEHSLGSSSNSNQQHTNRSTSSDAKLFETYYHTYQKMKREGQRGGKKTLQQRNRVRIRKMMNNSQFTGNYFELAPSKTKDASTSGSLRGSSHVQDNATNMLPAWVDMHGTTNSTHTAQHAEGSSTHHGNPHAHVHGTSVELNQPAMDPQPSISSSSDHSTQTNNQPIDMMQNMERIQTNSQISQENSILQQLLQLVHMHQSTSLPPTLPSNNPIPNQHQQSNNSQSSGSEILHILETLINEQKQQ